jgi:hypothetical protein
MAGLEDGVIAASQIHEARANVVATPADLAGLTASLWMGGARSLRGVSLHTDGLARSLIVDCAGEMPQAMREAAAVWLPCVFVDHDGPVAGMHRVEAAAREAAVLARTGDIDSVYFMCTLGMNRSGLVTGMILREFGLTGPAAVDRIATARPGALSNLWFRQLLQEA